MASLWKVPRDGGEETRVLESVAHQGFAAVSEGVYFIQKSGWAARQPVQFFDFKTKSIRSITPIENSIDAYLSISPDGRWILYSQIDQIGSDLLLVENFR